MAFVDENDKKLDDGQGGQPQNQTSTAPATIGGSSSADVGSGVSTAGVGAGGTGGWTNIQAYLDANKGSTTGSDYLNNTVGKQFDQDQSDVQAKSTAAKTQAKTAVDNSNIGQDQASQLISDWAKNPGNRDADKTKASNALNGQYSGPSSFTWGYSAPTQNYGTALNDDQGFTSLIGNYYNQQAGGNLNSGQLALQNQLDTNNEGLNSARNDLKAKYAALQGMATQTIGDTNKQLKNYQTQYGQNQKQLKDYLTGQMGTLKSQIDTATPNYTGQLDQTAGKGAPDLMDLGTRYNAVNEFLGNGSPWSAPVIPKTVYDQPADGGGAAGAVPGGAPAPTGPQGGTRPGGGGASVPIGGSPGTVVRTIVSNPLNPGKWHW